MRFRRLQRFLPVRWTDDVLKQPGAVPPRPQLAGTSYESRATSLLARFFLLVAADFSAGGEPESASKQNDNAGSLQERPSQHPFNGLAPRDRACSTIPIAVLPVRDPLFTVGALLPGAKSVSIPLPF